MATTTKTFSFLSNAESFVGTPGGSGITLAWDGTTGNPAGALKSSGTINSGTFVNFWEWTGTWETLGVTAGNFVTLAKVNASNKVTAVALSGPTPKLGPYTIRNNAGTTQATLWSGRNISSTDASFQTQNGTDQSIPVGIQPSNTTIKVRLENTMAYSGSNGAFTYHDDEVQLVITHTTGGGTGSATLSSHPTITSTGTHPPQSYAGTTTISRHPTFVGYETNFLAYYKLDETSGTSAADSSGNNRTGTYVGSPTMSINCAPVKFYDNRAMDVSGGSKMTVPSSVLTAVSTDMAIALWVYPRNLTSANLTVLDTLNRHVSLSISTSTVLFGMGAFTGSFTPSTVFTANQWQHIVFQKNGASGQLYRNGTLVSTFSVGATFFQVVEVGNNPSGTGSPFNGLIDNVRFYSRALSAGEATRLFNGDEISNETFYAPKYAGTTTTTRHPIIVSTGTCPVFAYGTQPTTLSRHPIISAQGVRGIPTYNTLTYSLSRHPTVSGTAIALGPNSVNSATLFIRGEPPQSVGSLDLFLSNNEVGSLHSQCNLYILGGNAKSSGFAPLYLHNNYSSTNKFVQLYIRGDGLTPGSLPLARSLNLYVERGPTGGMTLYLENKGGAGTIPLFIAGHPSISATKTLFIAGFGGSSTNSINLVIPKAVAPQILSQTITLVLPKNYGKLEGIQNLYIHGWS